MKKSQLRNIIRESIKQLMTEQTPNSHKTFSFEVCSTTPGFTQYSVGQILNHNMIQQGLTCNGAMCTQLDIDQGFLHYNSPPYNHTIVKLLSFSNPVNRQSLNNITSMACPAIDYGYKCESIWYIQTGKRDKNIGNQCIPGTQQNPGTHLTMQDCESNCDLQYIDGKTKTITPFTTDPQSMTKPKDDLVVVWPGKSDMKDRLQELANIK